MTPRRVKELILRELLNVCERGGRAFSSVVPVTTLILSLSCTPALPRHRNVEPENFPEEALNAQEKARQAVHDVKRAVARSEELLSEARFLLEEAKLAESRCRESVARIPRKARRMKQVTNTTRSGEGTTSPPGSPSPPKPMRSEPLYSPSDAPREPKSLSYERRPKEEE